MPPTHPLSFRTSPDKARKLDRLSEATQRPRSWLLQQALDNYLETQAWQIEHIETGLKELHNGQAVPHERVTEWLATWGTDNEDPAPE
jgi:predicted transcriptional regulator